MDGEKIMKHKNYLIIGILIILCVLIISGTLIIGGYISNTDSIVGSVIIGEFNKDMGHPFSGPAIVNKETYYRISGDKIEEILKLKDGTKVKVIGPVYERKVFIPQAGEFVEIIEKIIDVKSFEIL